MRIPFKKSFRALLEVVSSRENDRSNDKYTSKGCIQGLGHNLKHEAYLMYNLPKYYISFQFQVRDSKLKKKKANDFIKMGNNNHTNTLILFLMVKLHSLW